MMNRKEAALRAIVKTILKEAPKIKSFEHYCLECAMNGVTCSFDDDNFLRFLFFKLGQDYSANEAFKTALLSALSKFKLLDINKDTHAEIAETIVSAEIMGNHDYCQDISDYVMKNFPETVLASGCAKIALATGFSKLDLVEIRRIRDMHAASNLKCK